MRSLQFRHGLTHFDELCACQPEMVFRGHRLGPQILVLLGAGEGGHADGDGYLVSTVADERAVIGIVQAAFAPTRMQRARGRFLVVLFTALNLTSA